MGPYPCSLPIYRIDLYINTESQSRKFTGESQSRESEVPSLKSRSCTTNSKENGGRGTDSLLLMSLAKADR